MFSKNPFLLIDQFLLNNVQKFVLYLLDHYGILVSRTLIAAMVIFVPCGIYRSLPKADTKSYTFDLCFLAFIMLIMYAGFYSPTVKQLVLEKAGKIKAYNAKVETRNNDTFWVYTMLILMFLVMTVVLKDLVNDTSWYNAFRLADATCFSYYLYANRAYTRDRDPPMKGAFSVNPV